MVRHHVPARSSDRIRARRQINFLSSSRARLLAGDGRSPPVRSLGHHRLRQDLLFESGFGFAGELFPISRDSEECLPYIARVPRRLCADFACLCPISFYPFPQWEAECLIQGRKSPDGIGTQTNAIPSGFKRCNDGQAAFSSNKIKTPMISATSSNTDAKRQEARRES